MNDHNVAAVQLSQGTVHYKYGLIKCTKESKYPRFCFASPGTHGTQAWLRLISALTFLFFGSNQQHQTFLWPRLDVFANSSISNLTELQKIIQVHPRSSTFVRWFSRDTSWGAWRVNFSTECITSTVTDFDSTIQIFFKKMVTIFKTTQNDNVTIFKRRPRNSKKKFAWNESLLAWERNYAITYNGRKSPAILTWRRQARIQEQLVH